MKILYVTTISNTVNAFLIPHIKMLVEQGHHVDVAFNLQQKVDPSLLDLGCKVYNLQFQRSPLDKRNYFAYKKLKEIIKSGQYDMVHTHTPVASVCVRLACKNIQNVKVVYTAHGFHFFKGAPLKNWLIYYPIEYYLSKYTDVLITINNEDQQRAVRSFRAGKVEYIPGVGLNTQKINMMDVNKLVKRTELGISKDAIVILSVGELNTNKNHETVIRAIAKLNNPNVQYVICGKGPLEAYLQSLIKQLGLKNQVKLLGYRRDIIEICKISDIFCFPSRREGLGMVALEAMATGLPIITSNIHGIVDYSIDGVTGYLCNSTDVDAFGEAIEKLVNNEDLRLEMGKSNISRVQKFNIENSTIKMMNTYGELMCHE